MDTTVVESEFWDIFKTPAVDNSTEQDEYIEYKETNVNVTDLSKYEFFSKDMDAFLCPSKSFIEVKGKIVKDDNTAFAAGANIALVNNGFSIFKHADYLVNDQMCDSVDFPHQATTILNLIHWSDDYTRSAATASLWYKDTGNGGTERSRYVINKTGDDITSITDNGNFNMGFTIRADICKEGSLVTIKLPLSHIFGFLKDIQRNFRGVKHTIRLVRNSDKNIIHCAAGVTGDPKFQISHMSWWIPIRKPNLQVLARTESQLLNTSVKMCWESINMFRSEAKREISPTWRVSTSTLKPSHIYVVFQYANKDATYTTNNAIFDHLDLQRIHARISSKQFPLEEHMCDFTDKVNDYQRLYHAFLEAGYKGFDVDTGSQVSYSEFKTLYPIYCIDVSKREENVFETTGICDIELRLNLKTQPTADYHIYCLVVSERYATLQGISGRMNIIL